MLLILQYFEIIKDLKKCVGVTSASMAFIPVPKLLGGTCTDHMARLLRLVLSESRINNEIRKMCPQQNQGLGVFISPSFLIL